MTEFSSLLCKLSSSCSAFIFYFFRNRTISFYPPPFEDVLLPFCLCRQHISASDIKSLIAFFESSQDMACIEDVLHMVIRAVSQKQLLASFLEQVNMIGGCHIFVNLLERYDLKL